MYKKILVPIDGSELSYQAVEGAAKFACQQELLSVTKNLDKCQRFFAQFIQKSPKLK